MSPTTTTLSCQLPDWVQRAAHHFWPAAMLRRSLRRRRSRPTKKGQRELRPNAEPGSVGDGVPSLTQPIRAYSESSSTLQLIGSSKGSISCCLTSCMSLRRASAARSLWRTSRASSCPFRSMITAKNFLELVVIEASCVVPPGASHDAGRSRLGASQSDGSQRRRDSSTTPHRSRPAYPQSSRSLA